VPVLHKVAHHVSGDGREGTLTSGVNNPFVADDSCCRPSSSVATIATTISPRLDRQTLDYFEIMFDTVGYA
jgi:hypothetical protein